MNPPLTLLEEIVLLSVDDETGAHHPLPPFALGLGMAGAVLADLSMAGRISTDGPQVKALNADPTRNPLLDPWLALIAKESQEHSVHYWLSILANEKRNPIRGACPSHRAGDFKKGGQKNPMGSGFEALSDHSQRGESGSPHALGATYPQ